MVVDFYTYVVAIRVIRIVTNPASLLFYIEPGDRTVYDLRKIDA